jgi:hypothetical protein
MAEQSYAATDLLAVTRASLGWSWAADGTLAQAAAGAPRQDYDPATGAYRGLLIEAAAHNWINGGVENAAGGSPGTLPTGWSWSSSTPGVTRTLSNIGAEDGFPCFDQRITGTPSSTYSRDINLTGATTVAALSGEAWWSQVPIRIIAGSTTNIAFSLLLVGRNSGGSITETTTVVLTSALGAASLRSAFQVAARTMNVGTTAYVQPFLRFAFTSGQAVEITLRIGAPQLWKSATAFSPALAPAGSPGAYTRAADTVALAELPRWFNPRAGTFAIDFMPRETADVADRDILMLDNGTSAERVRLRMLPGDTSLRLVATVGGVGRRDAEPGVWRRADAAHGAVFLRPGGAFPLGEWRGAGECRGGVPGGDGAGAAGQLWRRESFQRVVRPAHRVLAGAIHGCRRARRVHDSHALSG